MWPLSVLYFILKSHLPVKPPSAILNINLALYPFFSSFLVSSISSRVSLSPFNRPSNASSHFTSSAKSHTRSRVVYKGLKDKTESLLVLWFVYLAYFPCLHFSPEKTQDLLYLRASPLLFQTPLRIIEPSGLIVKSNITEIKKSNKMCSPSLSCMAHF